MTIAEVSAKMGLTADTLRYYERIGLIPPVKRTSGGIRNYDENDLKWVEFIKCMRNSGVGVEALIEYVTMFYEGDSTIGARKELLLDERRKLKERMDAMQATLVRLDKKIDGYEERMLKYDQELRRS